MALTQSARLPGPSWDEEVVPALRKRLESESRTLAHRMSAISMTSNTEDTLSNLSFPVEASDVNARQGQQGGYYSINDPRPHTGYQYSQVGQPSTPTASYRVNGVQSARKPVATSFHRSRTYSQPGSPITAQSNSAIRSRAITGKSGSNSQTPYPTDARPTRIPKVSRAPNGHSTSPYLNGYGPGSTMTPTQSPNPDHAPDSRSHNWNPPYAAQSNFGIGQSSTRIINEPPPFKTTGSITSIPDAFDPPRASIDSEERPFEHWYRGEVSRNGGVGEIKVGRRQEMLEIANYGHTISSRNEDLASRRAALLAMGESNSDRRYRKRADSIAGIGTKGRERESLCLDEDERADQVDRVLDEDPLTDLDGENSDIGSISHYYRYSNHNSDYAFDSGGIVNHDITPAPPPDVSPPESTYTRSVTPTPSTIQRPSSRQTSSTSTRIPFTSERKSTESRSSARTQQSSGTVQQSRPQTPSVPNALPPSVATPSTKRTATAPPSSLPGSSTPTRRQAQRQYSSPPPHSSSAKRAVSPSSNTTNLTAAKKPKTKVARATRSKTPVKKAGDDESGRRSLAEYPSPGEGEDMADAIPVWTQPKPREGNWDDVVLPVVARKKGLNDYYETADGSPRPKKEDATPIAPAPGTFGYDGSKKRQAFNDSENIPMDEFGQSHSIPSTQVEILPEVPENQEEQLLEPETELEGLKAQTSLAYDHARVPIKSPPSPAPFSQYMTKVDNFTQIEQVPPPEPQPMVVQQEEDHGAGCCKCVVM